MPAKSQKQQKFMGRLLSDPEARKEAGIPLSVARKFARTGGKKRKSLPKRSLKQIQGGK